MDKKEAKEIGLNITNDTQVEDLMWQVADDILDELKVSEPFNPESLVHESIAKKGSIVVNQVYSDTDSCRIALIESLHLVSYYDLVYNMTYQRQKDLSLTINIARNNGHWVTKEMK